MAVSLITTDSSIFTLLSVEVGFSGAVEVIKPYLTAHSIINDSYFALDKSGYIALVAFHMFTKAFLFMLE